jgi:mRNA interferase HigB
VRQALPPANPACPLDNWFPLWEHEEVRIVTETRIREFIERVPRSSDAMSRWVETIETSKWRNPGELKVTFGSASFVSDLTVFNVSGNNYRVLAFVHYYKQIVYIKKIGTHKEYDQWDL